MRGLLILALLPLLPRLAAAQTTGTVERGTMKVLVRTRGTVRAEEKYRLNSSIEGRVEQVLVKPLSWSGAHKPMVYLLNKEMAAMMDSRVTTPGQILEERWEKIYKPAPVACNAECFVLNVYAQEGKWVRPQMLMIEAARKLRLVGRIRPGDAHWVKDGQILTFWATSRPNRKLQTKIDRFVIDVQGMKVEPGGTITSLLDSKHYLDPGTEWEGLITVLVKKDVLHVPTEAVIRSGGETFVPVRVSTGITTYEETEIEAGLSSQDKILILDSKTLKKHGLERHKPRPPAPRAKEKTGTMRRSGRYGRRRQRERESRIETLEEEEGKKDEFDDRFPSDLH